MVAGDVEFLFLFLFFLFFTSRNETFRQIEIKALKIYKCLIALNILSMVCNHCKNCIRRDV